MLETIVTVTLISMLIPLIGFAWIYDRGSNPPLPRKYKWGQGAWRRSREGKTIMAQKLALASFIAFITCLRIWGSFEGVEWFKLVGYLTLGYVFWVMLNNLIKVFKEKE